MTSAQFVLGLVWIIYYLHLFVYVTTKIEDRTGDGQYDQSSYLLDCFTPSLSSITDMLMETSLPFIIFC